MNSANFLATQTSFHNSYGISAQNPFDKSKTPQQHINNSSHQMLTETSSDTNLNQSSTNISLKSTQESTVISNQQRTSKTGSPHIAISSSSEHFPLEKLTQSDPLPLSAQIADLSHKSKNHLQELMTAQLADHYQGSNPKVRNDLNSHNTSKTPLKIPASLASLSPNSNKKTSQGNTPAIKVTQSADDHEFSMQEEIMAKMRPRRESSAGLLSTETLLKCKNETLQVQDLQSMSMDENDDSASDMNDTRSERSYKASRRGEPFKKKVRVCFNGLCITDPSDATLWCRQKVRKSNICKQCFEAYKKEQYCYFCYQIYIDNDTSAYSDGKEWIACDACARWHHVECEIEHGLKDVKQMLEDDTTSKYKCPPCRMPEQTEDTPPHKAKRGPKAGMQGKRGHQHHHDTEVRIKSQIISEINNREAYEGDHEEMIIKKAKLLSETSEEGFMTVPMMPNNLADMQREMKKKKLDSVINKSMLNKKKLQQKVFAPLELNNGIEHLLTQYAGKRLQLSDSEIRADLSLFRELSGSTCPTEEKSNSSSDGLGLDYLSSMWEEKNKSSEAMDEEKLLKKKDPKKKLQFKIVRSPGKFSLSRLQLSEEKFANRRQLRSHARNAQNVP